MECGAGFGVPALPAVVVGPAEVVVVCVVVVGLVVVVVVDDESFEHAAPKSNRAAIAVNTARRVIVR